MSFLYLIESMNFTHMKSRFIPYFTLKMGKSRTKQRQEAASLNGASVHLYFPRRFHTVSDNIAYQKGHSIPTHLNPASSCPGFSFKNVC